MTTTAALATAAPTTALRPLRFDLDDVVRAAMVTITLFGLAALAIVGYWGTGLVVDSLPDDFSSDTLATAASGVTLVVFVQLVVVVVVLFVSAFVTAALGAPLAWLISLALGRVHNVTIHVVGQFVVGVLTGAAVVVASIVLWGVGGSDGSGESRWSAITEIAPVPALWLGLLTGLCAAGGWLITWRHRLRVESADRLAAAGVAQALSPRPDRFGTTDEDFD